MDLGSIIFGFFLGVVFVIIVLFLSITISNRRFMKKTLQTATTIDNTLVKDLIAKKQKQLIKSTKIGLDKNTKYTFEICKSLIQEIAKFYYPDSKYPALEINLLEAIDFSERIIERVKFLLTRKMLGPLQNLRLSQVYFILEKKRYLNDTKVYQLAKEYHLTKIAKIGYTAIRFADPIYWVKKIIFTSTLETTLRGIGVITIGIVGEEAYQLYSKKVLANADKILDKEIAKFIKEIENQKLLE